MINGSWLCLDQYKASERRGWIFEWGRCKSFHLK